MDTPDRERRASEQQRRAEDALASILNGGDAAEESAQLSNRFTDEQTARLSVWLKQLRVRFRGRPSDDPPFEKR
jgi:hypothetical protein